MAEYPYSLDRNSRKKIILIISSPFILLLLLTFAGYIFHSRRLLAFIGLLLFCFFYYVFLKSDSILKLIHKSKDEIAHNDTLSGNDLLASFRFIFSFLSFIPVTFSVFLRGLALTVSEWTLDIYVDLLGFNLAEVFNGFVQSVYITLVISLLSLTASLREESIKKPAFLSKFLTVSGHAFFYVSMSLLIAALFDNQLYIGLKDFFSQPFWFLSPFEHPAIAIYHHNLEFLFVSPVLALICWFYSIRLIKDNDYETSLRGWGIFFFSSYILIPFFDFLYLILK